jgi:hypothetical protein
MREGWVGDDYLVLYEAEELDAAAARYSFAELLPGYKLVGLRGWDDFIVEDGAGRVLTVPTVPAVAANLAPFKLPGGDQPWAADERFAGMIKWYLKPVFFGGDPLSFENEDWIDHEKHGELVRYWNGVYRAVQE